MNKDDAEFESSTHKRFGKPLWEWMDKNAPKKVDPIVAVSELSEILPKLLASQQDADEIQKMLKLGADMFSRAAEKAPDASREIRSGVECFLSGIVSLLVEVSCLSIEKEAASIYAGHIAGSKPKRKLWAELTASKLSQIAKNVAAQDAWSLLPQSQHPWSFETDSADFEVYVDGKTLIAIDPNTAKHVGSLASSSFFKRYYRK